MKEKRTSRKVAGFVGFFFGGGEYELSAVTSTHRLVARTDTPPPQWDQITGVCGHQNDWPGAVMSTQVTAVTMGMQLVKATGAPVLMSIRMGDFYHHLSIWLANYNYLYLQTLCLHCRRAKLMNTSSFCGDNTYSLHFTTLKYTIHLLTTVTILYNSSLKWILPIWTVYPLSKIFHFHFFPPPNLLQLSFYSQFT